MVLGFYKNSLLTKLYNMVEVNIDK